MNSDGRHVMGYRQLVEQYKRLMEKPEYLLETEVGQKILAEAKDRIVEKVQQTFSIRCLNSLEQRFLICSRNI